MFDPNAFLQNQNIDGKLETQFSPIPAGEYVAMIGTLTAKEQPKKDNSGNYTIVDVQLIINDARAKEATGTDKPTIRDSIFLDIENGKIATGKNKNIQLGRWLEATELNGVPGNPFQQLLGKVVKVQVVVEPDKNDPTKIYNRVKAVGKL